MRKLIILDICTENLENALAALRRAKPDAVVAQKRMLEQLACEPAARCLDSMIQVPKNNKAKPVWDWLFKNANSGENPCFNGVTVIRV